MFLGSPFSFLGHGLYGFSPRGSKTSVSVNALVDSGADVHVLSYEDARKMFAGAEPFSLRIIGVNGSSSGLLAKVLSLSVFKDLRVSVIELILVLLIL